MTTPRRSEDGEVVTLRLTMHQTEVGVELETPAGGDTELAALGLALMQAFVLGYGGGVNSYTATDRDGNVLSAFDKNAEVN